MEKLNKTDDLINEQTFLISYLPDSAAYKKEEEYNRHLVSAVDNSTDTIVSESLDSTIQNVNKGGEKMFGYTAKEAIEKNISFVIPANCIKDEMKISERILQNKNIDQYETVRRKKSGKQISVSLTLTPLKDAAGNITSVSKIARDITPPKKIEEALIISNKQNLHQIVETEKKATELAIANKELDFQNQEKEKRAAELVIANKELLYQNEEKEKRAAELVIANKELLYQNEEKEKRAAELVIANKELLYQNEEKEKRAAELVIANKELLYQNEEKEKRAAELVIANKELLYRNEEKEKRAAELVIANKELLYQNEERENRAAELAAANKELESFTYSVSHDLRTPLRAINGFTEILLEDHKDQLDDDAQDILNELIANSNKMAQLIDDLLDFSRITKQQVYIGTINIKQMAGMVIEELKPLYPNRIITVIVNNLYNITGDSNMLKQVFINLISNAFKYTSKKEEAMVEIGSYLKDNYCIYYVKDNGAGFNMNYYDKLFGVFQRLHSSNEYEGTGVGLAIVQKIVTKHGGKVWAEGEVNEGACFYISLPVAVTAY